jgi:hypothetical protein
MTWRSPGGRSSRLPVRAWRRLLVAAFAVDRVTEVIRVVASHLVLTSDAYPERALRDVWGRTSVAQEGGIASVTIVAVRAGVVYRSATLTPLVDATIAVGVMVRVGVDAASVAGGMNDAAMKSNATDAAAAPAPPRRPTGGGWPTSRARLRDPTDQRSLSATSSALHPHRPRRVVRARRTVHRRVRTTAYPFPVP